MVQTRAVVKILRDLADALEACNPEGCRGSAGEGARVVEQDRRTAPLFHYVPLFHYGALAISSSMTSTSPSGQRTVATSQK